MLKSQPLRRKSACFRREPAKTDCLPLFRIIAGQYIGYAFYEIHHLLVFCFANAVILGVSGVIQNRDCRTSETLDVVPYGRVAAEDGKIGMLRDKIQLFVVIDQNDIRSQVL